MSSLKIFTAITTTLIIGLLVRCSVAVNTAEDFNEKSNNSVRPKFRFLFNNDEIVQSFIVDLPNSERAESDILAEIKEDHRLQEALIMQREQFQQIRDITTRLIQRMDQIEKSQNNITSIMELRLENQFDTLRKEMKRLFANQQCEKGKSCAEILMCLGNATNGIHQLYLPDSKLNPFNAYCQQDPKNGPAWTVIQRRQDDSTDFYRGWEEYKRGFGNLSYNFFIGLEKIHAMTQAQPHELRIQLEDSDGEKYFAKYNLFAIGNEADKYALNTLGNYNGNAGDPLTYYKGCKFSTKDSDNDDDEWRHCAEFNKGGWWYQSNVCYYSDFNGPYREGDGSENEKGIVAYDGRGSVYSYKYVQMAIRPRK